MSRTAEQLTNEIRITLMTMDEDRIREFARSWGIELPMQKSLFWIRICRAILEFPDMPKGIRLEAMTRLRRLGVNDGDIKRIS